jgi:hypothetical protein
VKTLFFLLSTHAKSCHFHRMANKPVPASMKAKAAGISLPPRLTQQARKHAYAKGMSLSGLVRQLLLEHLAEKEAAK